MKITVTQTRTCEIDTDELRDHFANKDSDAAILKQLRTDNGQHVHMYAGLFGWNIVSTTITKESNNG